MFLEAANRLRIMSAATTNATLVKSTPGKIMGINLGNTGGAAAFLKLYDKATSPVVGTDIPVETILIPAGTFVNYRTHATTPFALGIAYAITNLVADSDTTAVTLNQIIGAMYWV
jgi:hypothetical protein